VHDDVILVGLRIQALGVMKLAFVFWSLEVGGVEKMMTRMMSHYADRYEVVFVHIRPPIHVPQVAVNGQVKVVYLGARNIVSTVWRLARLLSTNPPDLVFTAMPTTNTAVILARLLSPKKFKLVVSERSDPSGELKALKSWRYRLAVRFAAYLYPWADAVVCVSSNLAKELMAKTGIGYPKLRVIYNPVVAVRTEAGAAEPVHEWLMRRDVPVLVAAARLSPEKGVSELVDMFAILRKRRKAKLIILGEGGLRRALEAKIAALGLTADVALPGAVADVMPWLERASLFVSCSHYEGFGNAIVEALAAGCPIVSTDCPSGPREILEDGRYGTLVPLGSIEAFADACEASLDLRCDREDLRRRGQDFSVENSLSKYDELFDELLYGDTRQLSRPFSG
jgi:glycosyltransferase involved in cell wall biosynthesis